MFPKPGTYLPCWSKFAHLASRKHGRSEIVRRVGRDKGGDSPLVVNMGLYLLALVSIILEQVLGHGSGAWKDPNHYDPAVPMKGMRFVSETTHSLTMVGSDDGSTWWSLKGFCTSPEEGYPMTLIHFDFTSKGGPADLVGVWAKGADGIVTLTWPDGNAWEQVTPSADAAFVPTPASTLAEATARKAGSAYPLLIVGAVVASAFAIAKYKGRAVPNPATAHAQLVDEA